MLRILTKESVVLAVILLSTVALLMVASLTQGSGAQLFWLWVDVGCVVLFVLEALAKILDGGWRSYWTSAWNRFDFVIVIFSLPVLVVPFWGNQELIGLPVLRLARLFRLFRFLHFIPDRDHLLRGVSRALRASMGVLLGVLLANFIFAMSAHVFFGAAVPELFGNPIRATFSMFQVFTIEGWHEVAGTVVNAKPGNTTWEYMVKFYFALSVFTGGIMALSIANAVFVDQMLADNTDPLEDKLDRLSAELKAIRELLENKSSSSTE